MANEEHLEILNQGVEAWNEWRIANPEVIPDFSTLTHLIGTSGVLSIGGGINYRGFNFSNTNFTNVSFPHVNLEEANLSGANLENANFSRGSFRRANFQGAIFKKSDFQEADFSEANLSQADLRQTDLEKAKFSKANLVQADLREAKLRGADFSDANLNLADLSNADLFRATLFEANLSQAILLKTDFNSANFWLANLRDAKLRDANLWGAILRGVDIRDADLENADLSEADIREANFRNTNLYGAKLLNTQALATNFEGAVLTEACLENWHISSDTNLADVTCECVYLKYPRQERRPHSRNFQPGEFTKLFQKVFETVDIVFLDGIEWKAFLLSFLELKAETGSDEISIQSFENRSGAFIVRINVSPDADKAETERFIEEKYKIALEAKDKHIESLEEQISVRYRESRELMSELVKITFKMSETKKIENNFSSYAIELQEEDYQHVIEQDKKRFSVLRSIYRDSGSKSNLATNSCDICQITGVCGEDLLHILEYLEKEDLIKAVTSLYAMYGGNAIVRITHKGIREVEAAMKKPDQPTNHFPAQVFYTTINAPLGALQQAGEGNSFTINQNIASNSNNEPSQE